MKIIDAHLHIFAPSPHTDAMAQAVGHQNSTEHLRQVYGELGMVHGVVMGNRSLEPSCHDYPAGLFHYCIGLDSVLMERGTRPVPDLADKVEENLKRETCCGVKLYPGYNRLWLSDHKHTRFVMCHFGNPFLESAAAVVEKNPNVAADLSGLLEGRVDIDSYFQEQAGYASLLTTWLTAIGQWDDIMYGTDWPIVNLEEYIRFIQRLVPERHWEKVFFQNANRIYGLGL